MSRKDTRALAVMAAVGIAGIVATSWLVSGPAAPPHEVGVVTVVLIGANVTALPEEAAELENGLDEISLPHCSFACLAGKHDELEYYAPSYDPSISTVVIVRYLGNTTYGNGGDDQLILLLHPGEQGNVAAALRAGTVLYSVQAEGPPWIHHALSTPSDGGNITATYRVNGTSDPFSYYFQGALRVNETHELRVFQRVPVILHARHLCI